MRRTIVLSSVISIVIAIAGPGSAKGVRPPATFEATGTIAIPDVLFSQTGRYPSSVTATEFLTRCDVPASQGVDGYVFELPEKISKGPGRARLSVSSIVAFPSTPLMPSAGLTMRFFDEDCDWTGYGKTFDAGTRFVLVMAHGGAHAEFTLTARETR